MEFAKPYFFIFGAVALCFWLMDFFKVFKKSQVYVFNIEKSKSRNMFRILLLLTGVTAWVLISYSLSRPRSPQGYAKQKIEVNDIFFIVDVSRSMLAEDFAPNRLEAAKKKILEFVKLRPTDRIGIIMFSEKAFTLLPLSTDLKLVTQVIDDINVGFLGMGTNIGDALALGVGRGAQSLAKNKVIILLTDGVSNVGTLTPLQAAEEAKKQKIKVYTIGIGKLKNKKVLRTGFGGRGSFQRIPGGSVDVKTLEEIAKTTGGKHFYAQNSSGLKLVLEEIQNLEKTEIEKNSQVVYKELYLQYLLLGGVLLLMTELSRRMLLKEVA